VKALGWTAVALIGVTVLLALFGGPLRVYAPVPGFPAGLLTFIWVGNRLLGHLPR
jgi:hypothetical protein